MAAFTLDSRSVYRCCCSLSLAVSSFSLDAESSNSSLSCLMSWSWRLSWLPDTCTWVSNSMTCSEIFLLIDKHNNFFYESIQFQFNPSKLDNLWPWQLESSQDLIGATICKKRFIVNLFKIRQENELLDTLDKGFNYLKP